MENNNIRKNPQETSELDERSVASISNWAFAWLGLADFGEDDDESAEAKRVVSW